MKGRKPVKPGPTMNLPNAHSDSSGTLDRDVQDVIGKQLRAMYDDLASQTLPDRLTELLEKLDKREIEGKH